MFSFEIIVGNLSNFDNYYSISIYLSNCMRQMTNSGTELHKRGEKFYKMWKFWKKLPKYISGRVLAQVTAKLTRWMSRGSITYRKAVYTNFYKKDKYHDYKIMPIQTPGKGKITTFTNLGRKKWSKKITWVKIFTWEILIILHWKISI